MAHRTIGQPRVALELLHGLASNTDDVHIPQTFNLGEAAELLEDSLILIRQALARIDEQTSCMAGEMLTIEWATDNAIRACNMIESLEDARHMDAIIRDKASEPGDTRR